MILLSKAFVEYLDEKAFVVRGRRRTGGLEMFRGVREDDPRLACVEIPA